ncbi:hypothetical protein D0T49_01930 [Paludibacter sp. 221]|uniref:hypothetical protein n=1 Tax=Paludibacter sp. 221 TaxID=2302939 RepID=UPI0013D24EE0|nr:hypothetical protein [Paludibacter sp. 221]NDV45809.1 hypothetical protein [Paludibacter sp. 221]
MIEHLQKLSPEIVERFLESREAEPLGIPPKLADYILQLNEASNLHRTNHSITECAKKLQQSYPELSIHTCKSRIYDAINYLNSDCTVTSEAWLLYYADMFMKMFEVNIIAHNFREARTCLQRSCEYRIKASANAIDPERIRFKPQIVSPDIELERMGVKRRGLLEARKRAREIIIKQGFSDTENRRLFEEVDSELNIQDTNYEEI